MNPDHLTEQELRRYRRQINLPEIGESGQLCLKRSAVLVIGVGGMGSVLLQYLTAAGVGRLGIIDNGLISEDNLYGQVLFNEKDLGKLKAIRGRERLSGFNPNVQFELLNLHISEENIQGIVKDYDLVADTSGQFDSHYLLDKVCGDRYIPFIYGATRNFEGEISVFHYKKGYSFRDLYPEAPPDEKEKSAGSSPRIAVAAGLTGSYMAVECLKVLLGKGEILSGKILRINAFANTLKLENIR